MDAVKIGKFICDRRNNLGYTQDELASKLNITNKAVSKWECGLGIPDITLFEPLSKELNVSVLELMHGEFIDNSDKLKKEDVEVLLETELKIEKKNSMFRKIMYAIVLIILLCFFIFYALHYFERLGDETYSLKDNFWPIPFDELYGLIYFEKTFPIGVFFRDIIVNSFASLLISILCIYHFKNKKTYVKTIVIINIIIEFGKWLLRVGYFDSDDIIIRILVGLFLLFIYEKIVPKIRKIVCLN